MFQRYALIFGRGAHRHRLAGRALDAGMHVLAQTSDMMLVGRANSSFILGERSIIVGQIFNPQNERLTGLPARLDGIVDRSSVEDVVAGIWGNYAFFSSANDAHLVYREPSASVPVYRCAGDHEGVFVSDADLATRLGLLERPEIDLTFAVHWLQFPFLRTRRTGIRGVTELLPGTAAVQRQSGPWEEFTVWHPSRFAARRRAIQSPEVARSLLRETALAVIPAQAKSLKPVLRLSGGLDSSIIAACLAQAHADVSCINFATRSRDGDERKHARAVARTLHLTLTEVVENELAPRLARNDGPSFLPTINPLLRPFERTIADLSQELGSTLLIDGAGGDNLFFAMSSAAPLIDALGSGQFRIARCIVGDIALKANATLWEVLAAGRRRMLRRRRAWKEDRSYLNRDSFLSTPDVHPWLEDPPALPGKREHVEAIVHIHHFLDRSPATIDRLHPLLAQPMLELCLRIPSWLWVRGGRDRAIAREAFAGLLPQSVLDRRLKGSLQSLLNRAFMQLRDGIRTLLMEGELARTGIIDMKQVSNALSREERVDDEAQLRLSEMAALELWLRSWRSFPWRRSIEL